MLSALPVDNESRDLWRLGAEEGDAPLSGSERLERVRGPVGDVSALALPFDVRVDRRTPLEPSCSRRADGDVVCRELSSISSASSSSSSSMALRRFSSKEDRARALSNVRGSATEDDPCEPCPCCSSSMILSSS